VYDFDSKLRNNGRSLAMRRKVLTNLKTVLSFAQSRGLVAQNVARGRIKVDTRETTSGPLRAGVDFPTMAELNTLIENSLWSPQAIYYHRDIHRHAPQRAARPALERCRPRCRSNPCTAAGRPMAQDWADQIEGRDAGYSSRALSGQYAQAVARRMSGR